MFPRNDKPERGYVRCMFPRNENRNEGTFAKTTLLRNRPFISRPRIFSGYFLPTKVILFLRLFERTSKNTHSKKGILGKFSGYFLVFRLFNSEGYLPN